MTQAAGVSPITVSRALRGERAVDPALVERVQAAARTLGYVPDAAAVASPCVDLGYEVLVRSRT